MKNHFTLLIFCCLFLSCSDNSSEATFANQPTTAALASTPEAKAEFDNSHYGIYKGIVIGSISGTLYVDLHNDNRIWAQLQTEDHQTYVLQNVPLTEGSGKNTLSELLKYRFEHESVSFEMELDESGNNIAVSNFKFFSDSTSKACLMKEKSTSLIKCYTGIFISDDESGSVNFTTNGELKVKGLSKSSNSKDVTDVIGEIGITFLDDGISIPKNEVNPSIEYKLNANLHVGQISGPLNRYAFDGNWMYGDNKIGDWYATRLL